MDQEAKELKVLETYLPTLMSEEEIKKLWRRWWPNMVQWTQRFWKSNGVAMKELKGKADATIVTRLLKENCIGDSHSHPSEPEELVHVPSKRRGQFPLRENCHLFLILALVEYNEPCPLACLPQAVPTHFSRGQGLARGLSGRNENSIVRLIFPLFLAYYSHTWKILISKS